MSYDEKLAERLRELLSDSLVITEKKMFGGLAFLVNGHMTITVSGKGGILVRVNPSDYEAFSVEKGVDDAVMKGKKMRGWLRVSNDCLKTKRQLKKWLDRSIAYTKTLPPKK